MIQLFNLSKVYAGGFPALLDLNLQIGKGEFVFLTGPSGAGKTTLLRLIFCEEKPSEGQILVDNCNLARIKQSKIPFFRRNIGIIFQDFRLLPEKSLAENIALPLRVAGQNSEEIKVKVLHALKEVGLAHKVNCLPKILSGGEQQRAAIARAIIVGPKIILADEPTGNLDAELTAEILKLLLEINLRGTTVIIATHDKNILGNTSKRVIALERGRVIEDKKGS